MDSSPNLTGRAEAENRQLLALREATLAISSNLSLSETLQRIVIAAARLVNARYAALGVPDDTGEMLVEFITTGMTDEEEARISHRPRGHGILGVILHEGKSLRLTNLREHPKSAGFPANHPPMTSFLGVPIIQNSKQVGNLYLTDKRDSDEFTEEDQGIIELLASNASVALRNANLYQSALQYSKELEERNRELAAVTIENTRLSEQITKLAVVEERQRIGMDLHDGIIQSIYGVGLMLEYINAELADGTVKGNVPRLKQAIDSLNAIIRDIRAYILDLRPRQFEGDNLIAGLQRLLIEFKANTLIDVTLIGEPEADAALTSEARLALFHIAQEALSNAAKHSHATHIDIRLVVEDQDVVLAVEDNGRGFDPGRAEQRMGHGLNNMRDRTSVMGGQFGVGSDRDTGTEVKVKLPLKLLHP
jgi:signal transduction histidine kinase